MSIQKGEASGGERSVRILQMKSSVKGIAIMINDQMAMARAMHMTIEVIHSVAVML